MPHYFTSSAVDAVPAGSVAIVYPYPLPSSSYGQLWQAESAMRFVMPGGYFLVPVGRNRSALGFQPTLTAKVLNRLYAGTPFPETPSLRTALRRQWHAWHVESLLFAPLGPDPHRTRAELAWIVGRSPTAVTGGVDAWYHLGSG